MFAFSEKKKRKKVSYIYIINNVYEKLYTNVSLHRIYIVGKNNVIKRWD